MREQLIDSTLGNFPGHRDGTALPGASTRREYDGAGHRHRQDRLRIGFAAQNAMNTVWNIPYVHWPSHLDAIRAHLRGDRPADEDPLDALDALDDGDELGSGTEQLGRCLLILSLGRRLLFEIAPAGAEG